MAEREWDTLRHEGTDECIWTLSNLQAFLHHETTAGEAEEVQRHLRVCPECMEHHDIETAITLALQRCCSQSKAPASLRISITETIIRRVG